MPVKNPGEIVGIDPSLGGFAMLNVVEDRYRIATEAEDFPCFSARYEHMRLEITRALGEFRPPLVVIEGFAFNQRAKGSRTIEQNAIGILTRHLLWQLDIPFIDVVGSTLKKYVTGSGNAEKNTMILEVYKKWGYTARDDNDADAYALARFGEDYQGNVTAGFDQTFRQKVTYTHGRSLPWPRGTPRPAKKKRSKLPVS